MLGQTMKLNVVGKSRYKFNDENTGVERKGAKIFVEATPVNEPDKVGVFQTELNLAKYEDFEVFSEVPGSYDVEMFMQAGKAGAKFIVQSAKLLTPTK